MTFYNDVFNACEVRKCGIQWHSLALRGIEIVIVVIHLLNKVSNRARQICTTIERLVQHDKGCSRKYRTGGWACKHFCPPYPVQNFFFGLPPTSEVYQYLSLPYPALLPLNSACNFFCNPHHPVTAKNVCRLTPLYGIFWNSPNVYKNRSA